MAVLTSFDGVIWRRLAQRKLVQWTLGYLASAWVIVQVLVLLGDQYGWREDLERGIVTVAFAGALPVAVLAWFRGERGVQRVSALEATLLVLTLATALGAGTVAYRMGADTEDPPAARADDALAEADLAFAAALSAPAGRATLDGYRSALAAYRKACALAPGSPRAWLGQVRTALALHGRHPGDPREFATVAREGLATLERIAPESVEALTAAALVASRLDGDRERAIGLAVAALEAGPAAAEQTAQLRNIAIGAAFELGQWDRARILVERWLTHDPDSVALWRYRGEIAVAKSDWSAAREAFDRAITLSQPADIELQIARSWVEIDEDGDLAAWDAYLRRIEPAYGANARYIYQAWHAALSSGDFERAIALVESSRATDWEPHGKDDLLGETYFMMGDLERARRVLAPVQEARELAVAAAENPSAKAWTLAMLGQVRALRGERTGAVAALDEAYALLPPRPRSRSFELAHRFIGIWFGLAHEPARATAVLAEALERPLPQLSPNGLWLHHSTGPLRAYPPFEALLRSHGADTSRGYRPPATPQR
jgi:tetratricopeptide (TPR) repeat protein